MKNLSDYKGDEAIELWADLLDPLTKIIGDDEVRKVVGSGESKIAIAKVILKSHKEETVEILTRIDPEPINGLTIVLRLVHLLADIGSNDEVKSFFGFAEQAKMDNESFGSPTESTKEEEN